VWVLQVLQIQSRSDGVGLKRNEEKSEGWLLCSMGVRFLDVITIKLREEDTFSNSQKRVPY
jgi:hypothetical protein